VAQGIEPSVWKKQEKAARIIALRYTSENIAIEWHETKISHRSDLYRHKVLLRLKRHAFPKIGKLTISHLEIPDILGVVKPMEQEGHTATAKYAFQNIGQIFRYAVLTGRAKHKSPPIFRGIAVRPDKAPRLHHG